MPSGGKRQGAGRKPGLLTKKTREIACQVVEEGITPLQVIVRIMRDALGRMDYEIALEAAGKAAPYIHPKLSSIEHTGRDGEPIQVETTVSSVDLSKLNEDELIDLERILSRARTLAGDDPGGTQTPADEQNRDAVPGYRPVEPDALPEAS